MIDTRRIYDAVVVDNVNDNTNSGAIRVNILGITDTFKENTLPWAYPVVGLVNKVPTKGTFVTIRFRQDDMMFLEYMPSTSLGGYLAPEYVENYPNVAVFDMGIVNTYDKSTNEFTERNDSTSYNRTVTSNGATEVSTPQGFSIVDGEEILAGRVVTEDTVNLMTGRPIKQGSEFYKIPTFNRETIESEGTAGFA